jgi:hypothetical protein
MTEEIINKYIQDNMNYFISKLINVISLQNDCLKTLSDDEYNDNIYYLIHCTNTFFKCVYEPLKKQFDNIDEFLDEYGEFIDVNRISSILNIYDEVHSSLNIQSSPSSFCEILKSTKSIKTA